MRPGLPFCGTSQSSAPVAFRQCGRVVLFQHCSVHRYLPESRTIAVPYRGCFSGIRKIIGASGIPSMWPCCARSQWGLLVQSASSQYKVALSVQSGSSQYKGGAGAADVRPGVPFCRTSQSSAPVAFRQCGLVVLVHNELLCSFTMGAFSAKCQPSKQSSSSQYTVGALSTKGEQGALLSGLGCFFLGPRNHRRQRHFVNMAVLCFFQHCSGHRYLPESRTIAVPYRGCFCGIRRKIIGANGTPPMWPCCTRVQSARSQYKVAALSAKWELSVQKESMGGCCAAWGAFWWDLAIIGASGISSMWPCCARSQQSLHREVAAQYKVAPLSTKWQLSVQGARGGGCCAASGFLFWDLAKSSPPKAFRRCGPVVLVQNGLLCSFTMATFSAKCQPSVQSSSSQYKVGALSTKGEQGGLLCGLGCLFVGPRNHRRQWHFVHVALSCSFTSVQSSSSQYKLAALSAK